MRKLTLAILVSLLPVVALGQGTIDDLPAASSLGASDMLACAQGTTVTKKCSLEQVKDWLITYFDTEAEFEAILTDVANMIVSTEIDTEAELEALLSDVSNMLVSTELDTEAELEALLGDVTDVYTDNDSDFVTQAEIADNAVQEEHLKAVNAATDEYYLTYESTTGDFEWVAGTGGGATSEAGLESDLADVTDVYTDNDVDFIDSDDLANDDWGDISISNGSASIDDSTVGSPQIDNDSILAEDLYADNVGVADDIATFSATADNFAWQTPAELSIGLARQAATDCTAETGGLTDEQCHELDDNTLYICETGPCNGSGWVAYGGSGGGGATSEAGLESDLADTTNVLTDNDASITFDGAIDLITSANGDINLSPNGTGETNINSPLNTQASAAPTIAFKDSDSAKDPPDDNATISGNLSVTGDGSENMDVLFQHQVGGVPTDFMSVDADNTGDARITFPDSSIGADEIMATGQTNGYYLQWATGDVLQWAVGAGGAFNDASDPIVPNTTTKDLQLGDGAGTLTGKLEIGGDADQPQMVIEGYSTQTDSILIVQNDADTEVFAVDNDGTANIGTGDGSITGSAGGVDLVLGASDVATIGDGGTTDYVEIDENGVISWNGTAGLGAGTIDALTEFADLCAGSEAIARNSGDSAWECASIGSGSGDNVEIDSVGVTDPDFQSTGDVDFVDTSNVVTANLNIDVVDASHMADADHGDVAWSSGDATVDTIALETASLTSLADDEVLVGDGAASGSFLALQNCNDTTEKLDWTGTAFSCVTDQTGGSTSWDVTDTDASPILTVDDTEQVQFIGAGTVTVVAAADSTDHDVTITGSAHTTASGITMGGDVSSTADSAQVDDVQSATTNLEAADNDTTQVASTSFVQQEINGAGGTDLSCSGGQCNVDSPVTSATTATTATLGDSATAFFSEGEIEKAYLPNVESLDTTGGTDGYHLQQTGATTYEFDWTRIRYHASDCTGLTDGEQYEPCWELDDNTLYVCETATCNAAGWAAATAAGDGVGYDTVEDNGTPETQRAILNMISGGTVTVSCTDNVDTTDCTFTGSAHDGTGTDNQNLSVTAGGADTSVIDIEDGTDVTISGGSLTNVTEAGSTITVEGVATLSSYTDDLSHVEESTTVTDNADGMDITLSTYDITVALDPSEVANQAGDLADLVPYEDVTDGGIHHMTFTQVQTLVADGTGTDDQVASEVPFTPDDNGEWGTPPSEVDAALEDLAPRVTANDAKVTESTTVTDNADGMDITLSTYDIAVALDPSEVGNQAPDLADLVVYEDVTDGGIHQATFTQVQTLIDTGGSETNTLTTMGGVADMEIALGASAGVGAYLAVTSCAADEKPEFTDGTPNTFTCEPIGGLVDADIGDISNLATGAVDALGELAAMTCTGDQYLARNTGNSAWECVAESAGGGTTGSAGDIQYSDGASGHDSEAAFNYTEGTNLLTVQGDLTLGPGTATDTVITADEDGTDGTITWDNANDEWDFSAPISVGGTGSLIRGNGTGDLDIDANDQNVTIGDASGNEVSISNAGVLSFAGTGDINLPAGAVDALTELGAMTCTGDQYLARNTGDSAWECVNEVAGGGTVTDVGDCDGPSCFDGTEGTTLTFETAGAADITLAAASSAAGSAITLPDETGTVCTTGSVCSGYDPTGGDDLSDDNPTALSGVSTMTDSSFCQGNASTAFDCDVTQANIPGANHIDNTSEIQDDIVTTGDIDDASDAPAEGELVAVGATTTQIQYVKPPAICKTLFDSGGLAVTDDIDSIYRWSAGIVIDDVWCDTDTGTTSIDVQDGSANLLANDCACDTGGETCGSLTNTAFTDGELVDLVINTTSSNRVTFCMEYHYDL